jgi:transposase InsO family protein
MSAGRTVSGARSTLPPDLAPAPPARAFRQACERLGTDQSMGRPGSALDNAVIEFELPSLHEFTARAQARSAVAARIEDCNTARRHSAPDMRSPAVLLGAAWLAASTETLNAVQAAEPQHV